MSEIILTTEERLTSLFKNVLKEHEQEKMKLRPSKLYTINQVAKMTHMSHATIKKKVMEGVIKSTPDGLITEQALNDYLTLK
jgi:hypothetical protein